LKRHNHTMHTLHTVKTRQRGAILVISLLILLILTLIGINSLNNSIMEEKMAANSQIATAIFQKAESSIREAYYAELADPFGAVAANRADASPVDRSHTATINDVTIISSSQHVYNPDGAAITMINSSGHLFEARTFEIIGTARVGAIRSINTQGYIVLNVMHQP